MSTEFKKLNFVLVAAVLSMSCQKNITERSTIFDGSGNPPSVFTTKSSKPPTDPAFMVTFNIKDSSKVRSAFLKNPLHFDYRSIAGANILYNDGSF